MNAMLVEDVSHHHGGLFRGVPFADQVTYMLSRYSSAPFQVQHYSLEACILLAVYLPLDSPNAPIELGPLGLQLFKCFHVGKCMAVHLISYTLANIYGTPAHERHITFGVKPYGDAVYG